MVRKTLPQEKHVLTEARCKRTDSAFPATHLPDAKVNLKVQVHGVLDVNAGRSDIGVHVEMPCDCRISAKQVEDIVLAMQHVIEAWKSGIMTWCNCLLNWTGTVMCHVPMTPSTLCCYRQ